MSEVKKDSKVKVHYTGKLSNGEVFDSSKDRDPLEFTMGQGQLIPGFENAILGMKVDEEKTVDIPSKEAYGPLRDDLKQEVPKKQLPDDLEPKEGMQLVSKTPEGREIMVTVDEIKDESIVVDANHPLAGKDLTFEIKVVDVK